MAPGRNNKNMFDLWANRKKNIFLSKKKEILSAANFCHFLRLFIQFISFYYFFFKKLLYFTFAKKLRMTLNFEYTLRQPNKLLCFSVSCNQLWHGLQSGWSIILEYGRDKTYTNFFLFQRVFPSNRKAGLTSIRKKSKWYDGPHY